ncbi:MAG: large conductance mechanosensitive channel protein MscL [Microbacterium sp.]|uniref:large conductance mechanosensitive channel protein MscL n=1 Tax=Microbacterium sp. TaxID=51671 RepID=UPI003A8B1B40
MINGFKDFIMRGNVIDLAVAVVIGAAFTAVVNAFVEGIINPLIGLFFNAESLNDLTIGVVQIGAVIGAIIYFVAVALVVYFVFILPMNKAKDRQARKAGIVEEEPLPSEQELLVQIRDLLEKQKS